MYSLIVSLLILTSGLVIYLIRKNRDSQLVVKQVKRQIAQLQNDRLGLEEQIFNENALKQMAIENAEFRAEEYATQMAQMERYKLLVEDTDEFLFETDYKGQFQYANPVMLNRLGYAQDELSAIKYENLVLPGREKEVFAFYNHQYHEKQPDSYAEWQVINRFGEELWVGLRVRMTFDPLGRIASVKGIARDLSIQRNLEKRNQQQIRLFEDIFKLLPGPVLVFQKEGKGPPDFLLTWANQQTLRLMNFDWFEVAGLRMEDVSSSLVATVIECLSATGKQNRIWSPRTQPDKNFEVIANQSSQHVLIMLADPSDWENKVQAVEIERDFFKMVVDEMPFDLAVFSIDERFVYINPSAVKNEEVRQWMMGKTDSEYMKYRQKGLFNAVLRRQRFDEVRSSQATARFNELFLDGQGRILHFTRNLKPVFGSDNRVQNFIAAGFNYTDLYQQHEPFREVSDRLLFQALIVRYRQSGNGHIEPTAIPDSYSISVGGKNSEGTQASVFQYYVDTIANLEYLLRFENLALEFQSDFPLADANSVEIYRFPKILLLETIRLLQLNLLDNGRIELHFDDRKEGYVNLWLEFTRIENLDLGSMELLQVLVKIWVEAGQEVDELGQKIRFGMVMEDQRMPLTDKDYKDLQVLKNKRILIGPKPESHLAWLPQSLKESGAVISFSTDPGDLPQVLEKENFHLIIWLDGQWVDNRAQIQEMLQRFGLKMLVFESGYVDKTTGNDQVIIRHEPKNLSETLELVWLHTKDDVPPAVDQNDLDLKVQVNFDKLIEITNGDWVFMQNLIQSYRVSLQECQEVFVSHMEAQDTEGLRFLLHKARATIKTFEIKPLENVIRESIEAIESTKGLTTKRKKDMIARLRTICTEARKQIDAYAQQHNLLN